MSCIKMKFVCSPLMSVDQTRADQCGQCCDCVQTGVDQLSSRTRHKGEKPERGGSNCVWKQEAKKHEQNVQVEEGFICFDQIASRIRTVVLPWKTETVTPLFDILP